MRIVRGIGLFVLGLVLIALIGCTPAKPAQVLDTKLQELQATTYPSANAFGQSIGSFVIDGKLLDRTRVKQDYTDLVTALETSQTEADKVVLPEGVKFAKEYLDAVKVFLSTEIALVKDGEIGQIAALLMVDAIPESTSLQITTLLKTLHEKETKNVDAVAAVRKRFQEENS